MALSVECHEGSSAGTLATFANPDCAPLPLKFWSIVLCSPPFAIDLQMRVQMAARA